MTTSQGLKAVKVLISGRVQGVCYRASTKDMADRLGLSGWVRNLADGRVEAYFEGPERDVQKAIDWCRQGPPAANVEGLEFEKMEPEEAFQGFSVKH